MTTSSCQNTKPYATTRADQSVDGSHGAVIDIDDKRRTRSAAARLARSARARGEYVEILKCDLEATNLLLYAITPDGVVGTVEHGERPWNRSDGQRTTSLGAILKVKPVRVPTYDAEGNAIVVERPAGAQPTPVNQMWTQIWGNDQPLGFHVGPDGRPLHAGVALAARGLGELRVHAGVATGLRTIDQVALTQEWSTDQLRPPTHPARAVVTDGAGNAQVLYSRHAGRPLQEYLRQRALRNLRPEDATDATAVTGAMLLDRQRQLLATRPAPTTDAERDRLWRDTFIDAARDVGIDHEPAVYEYWTRALLDTAFGEIVGGPFDGSGAVLEAVDSVAAAHLNPGTWAERIGTLTINEAVDRLAEGINTAFLGGSKPTELVVKTVLNIGVSATVGAGDLADAGVLDKAARAVAAHRRSELVVHISPPPAWDPSRWSPMDEENLEWHEQGLVAYVGARVAQLWPELPYDQVSAVQDSFSHLGSDFARWCAVSPATEFPDDVDQLIVDCIDGLHAGVDVEDVHQSVFERFLERQQRRVA